MRRRQVDTPESGSEAHTHTHTRVETEFIQLTSILQHYIVAPQNLYVSAGKTEEQPGVELGLGAAGRFWTVTRIRTLKRGFSSEGLSSVSS